MTSGSELGHILRFTLPLLAGNLFQQLYNIVDSIIVGRYLGSEAFASVGETGSVTFLFYNLCIGLATGAGILISQGFGAKKSMEVKRLIANSAYVLLVFGILISVVSVICAPLLLLMLGTLDSIFDAALGYMRIACAGTVAVAAYNWINAVMRALGDSRTPLVFLIVASVLNAGLDLLFVVGFGMGINGAAWATVTAQGIAAAGSIIFAFIKNPYFKLSRRNAKPNSNILYRCIRTGVPVALQNSVISVSMIYLLRTANSFKNEDVIAAYTATMRVEQLIQQPFASLGAALSTFTGQNIGAGKADRVRNGYRQGVKAVVIFSLAMLLIFLFFSKYIIGVFVKESVVLDIGAKALKLSACFYIPLGLIHTTRGLLNGAGDVGYTMINGFSEVAGRIGFATLLVHIPIVGYWAIWGTSCLTWALTGIMSVIRYKGGKWKNQAALNALKEPSYQKEENKI